MAITYSEMEIDALQLLQLINILMQKLNMVSSGRFLYQDLFCIVSIADSMP